MSVRVLALTRYDRAGASSRVRFYQYLPALRAAGVDVVVEPLFDAGYLDRLYAGQPTNWRAVASAYGRRVAHLLGRVDADLVWIEYELLPWLPWTLERWLLPARRPFVVEYDDAVFHRYDLGSAWVRRALGTKLDRLMAAASCVIAGNAYLAARARAAGATRVEVIPSVVDLRSYERPPDEPPAAPRPFTVGWLGSPSTTRYIQSLAAPLARLATTGPLRVLVVGASPVQMPGVTLERRTWSEAREAADIGDFDVGVMPLEDSPWERGKCGYKLVQYMACAKPVGASPVGVNVELARPGETGFLASTPEEWVRGLASLRDDAAVRQRMGQRGRTLVEASYSLQATAPRLAATLTHAARGASVP